MKYLFAIALSLIFGIASFGQTQQPAYLQYKTVPSVRLLNADSTGFELKARLDKKKPLMIVIFSPECEHCKHETEEMVKNIDKFKDIQIMMLTQQPLYKMNEFTEKYGLKKYKNIIVARDYAYVLPTYYDLKSLPYHAFYTKDKKLITGFEGTMTVQRILTQFK